MVEQVQTGEQAVLWLGDCLEVLPTLADGSVDLVLADPPYGHTESRGDERIPLGPLWEELRRVLRPLGAVVLTASQPFTTDLINSNRGWFKYSWVWERGYGFARSAPRKPIKVHEDVVVFSEGTCGNGSRSPMPYNPQGLVEVNRRIRFTSGSKADRHRPGRNPRVHDYTQSRTGYPKSLLRFPPDCGLTVRLHPTQKPVALMEYLVKTYTNPGQVVLDFAMGSGSTGIGCLRSGRVFLGVEKDEWYFGVALKRLEDWVPSL